MNGIHSLLVCIRIRVGSRRAVTTAALLLAAVAGCTRTARERAVAERTIAEGTIAERPIAVTDYSLDELPSSWRDQHGDSLTLAALSGRVRVVAMVYTSCTATCPLIIADLKRIESAVPAADRARLGFVLVSLDPWRDTPGRLAAWAKETGLDPATWTLLAGTDDSVREVASLLDVRYQRQPGGELAHTNGLTVLDDAGHVAYRQVGLGGTDETIRAVRGLLQQGNQP